MFRDKRLNGQRIAQWNEAAKLLTRQSLAENSIPDDPQSHWVWVRNDSGSDHERFECMALSDPIFNLDLDGSVDLMFKGIASASDKTPVILLEPIAKNEMGKGIIHGLALAKVGSGSTTAKFAAPGTNNLTPGSGSIKLLGSPSASTDTLLPVLLGGNEKQFFELLEDMPAGHGNKAWAKFLDWDLNTAYEGYVYNWGKSAAGIIGYMPSGFFGECASSTGRLAFNQAECGQKCITGTYIPFQTPTDATIGSTSYSYTVTTTGSITSGSFTASGLPGGWAINASTGVIIGPTISPGVVGPARDLAIFIRASAPKTGGGTCSLTRRIIIKIKP